MIQSIAITNHLNDRLVIDMKRPSYAKGFYIKNITGLDPVKANINISDYSIVDGGAFNSARLPPRNIVLRLGYLNVGTPTIEEIRQSSYTYFPIKKRVKLEIFSDRRKCEIYGYIEHNEIDIFSRDEGSVISIMCPDPYFYSIEDGENTTIFYSVVDQFTFPFSNESTTQSLIIMGAVTNQQEANVIYKGDANIGVTMDFYARGDVSNISIYNMVTREEMHLDIELIAGDELFVSTNKGSKSITLFRDGVYFNALVALDINNSVWFQLSKGDNLFSYEAEEGLEYLQLKIMNRVLYEGV